MNGMQSQSFLAPPPGALGEGSKGQLERAVDGAPSQIPKLKFLTPSSPIRGHEPGNRMTILFNMFFYLFL